MDTLEGQVFYAATGTFGPEDEIEVYAPEEWVREWLTDHLGLPQGDTFWVSDMRRANVPMSNVVPTQTGVWKHVVEFYRTRNIYRYAYAEDTGRLFGVRLKGSNNVFLMNGHHRWYVALEQGRTRLSMLVWDLDVTYEEASEEWHNSDFCFTEE